LFTYSFYNHLGLSYKDRYYYPKNTGSALDLDGLFGDETKAINRSVRNEFIKFKNALVLN